MERMNLRAAALIVIDMQRYFLEKGASAYLGPRKSLVPNVIKLVQAFRDAGRPIVFTRHAHKRDEKPEQMWRWWDGKLPWDGDEQAELINEIKPLPDEIFITKTKYSAFEGTDLDIRLTELGIAKVVICGVVTNLCVETTARHAFMKNFQPIVVKDACASNSKEFHNAAITNLEYGFAYIETTESILTIIKK